MALPGAREVNYKGDPWFNVGRKTFACHFGDRTILKLDKAHQELLFEIRPETFTRCRVGTGYWAYVALDRLDEAELTDLVQEAWSTIVPKRVSRPYLEAAKPPAP